MTIVDIGRFRVLVQYFCTNADHKESQSQFKNNL